MATLTIQQAIDTAKQNPNSEFAKTLRASIESGSLDQAAAKQGVDLSPYGRNNLSGVQETKQDVSNIAKEGVSSFEKRADKVGEIMNKDISPVSKVLQTVGQGAGVASDVLGATFKGAVKAVLPQKQEQAVKSTVENVGKTIVQSQPAQLAVDKYQELKQSKPELVANIEAGANLLALIADVASLGAGKKVAEQSVKVGTKAAKVSATGAKQAGRLTTKGAVEAQGALSGTSGETLEVAYQAAKEGGKALEAYTSALRKQTTPEQLVQMTRSAVDVVSSEKSQAFAEMIKKIGSNPVVATNLVDDITKTLGKLKITVDDKGVLNFGASKFRTVGQPQAKLQALYDEVITASKAKTLDQIDTSRQALKNLLLAGDDASARTANMVITDAINKVRSVGAKVDGYEDALAKFGDDAEFLDELNRALSTGDNATIDTAYRKLATTLKTNNEQRMNLLKQLDERTDGTLLASIAGQQLSEELPRGIFRQIMAGVAGASVLSGGTSMAAVLPGILFASPRVTGEFVRALGIGATKANQVIKGINNARKLLLGGVVE